MFKKSFFIFANLIFLLLISINQGIASEEQSQPVVINAVKAQLSTWQKTIMSTGTLVAEQGVVVSADISGRITKIFFKSGQYVKKNAPLVRIFPDVLKAELKQYQATLNLAQLNFERYDNLYKKKATSKSEYDTAKAKYAEAQANLQKIKAQLRQTLVRAPFSGFLGIRKVNLGTYINAGDAIVNLEDTNPMFVDFMVPEIYSKKVHSGQTIEIQSIAYGKKRFKGKVMAVESLINSNTRMLGVRAVIPNKDNELIPGSFVQVKIYIGAPKKLIKLPQTAIEYSAQGNYVFLVQDNKAVKTYVTLGERGNKDIFITKGLKAGDEVVVAGQQKLYDGAKVSIKAG